MRLKTLLRPTLTVVLGFLGAFIAKNITPPDIFAKTGDYFLIIAIVAFGILGFILPELFELVSRAGIVFLASQIARHLPRGYPGRIVAELPFGKKKRKGSQLVNPLIIDTSAIIDGRLLEVAKLGFLYGTLIIIPSVVDELHKLSDSPDDLKRARGRRGLDFLADFRNNKKLKIEVYSQEPDEETVDAKLVALAKKISGKVVTVDFNLTKVAHVKKVGVLNLNDLTNAVKMPVLPHERLVIQIKMVGKGKDQGIGYLDDGTMVVVENGAQLIGKTVGVDVQRVLQTAAGKMIFGKPVGQ